MGCRTSLRESCWAAALAGAGWVVAAAVCPSRVDAAGALDDDLRAEIGAHGLRADPSPGRRLPDVSEPLAQLGKKLFFSKALSGDSDTACASCHHPLLGGGDRLPLSIGVGAVDPDLLGPGRAHPGGSATVPRNAPTTFNSGMWDRAIFHDGRVESLSGAPKRGGGDGAGIRTPDSLFLLPDPLAGDNLVAAQARFPIVSQPEMRGFRFAAHESHRNARNLLVGRLGGYGVGAIEAGASAWPAEFARVFGAPARGAPAHGAPARGGAPRVEDLVNDRTIAAAIGAYERSQVFVANPWRDYVRGDDSAISDAAKRGALLFLRDYAVGGAGCANCHRGDFFTDERFHTLAVPQIGPGTDDVPYPDKPGDADEDFGRFHATFDVEDRYRFRTPSLLNVGITAPYGHDGAYATLAGIVRHHLDPAQAVRVYDASQLGSGVQTENLAVNTARAVEKLAQDRARGASPLRNVALSDAQVEDLVSFLRTLTDPCAKDAACLAPWLPGVEDSDPDGSRLRARFREEGST